MVQPSRLMNHRVSVNGVSYFPIKKVADYHGISIEWDGLTQKAVLYKDGKYLSFITGEPFYLLNSEVKTLKYPPKILRGRLLLPKEIALKRWWDVRVRRQPLGMPKLPFRKGQFVIRKIVLDPGHGGHDHGARAWGVREKNVNLQIAKKIRDRLIANGIHVFMTRTTDRFIKLSNRARLTNRSDADLFISIHANAAHSRQPYGFEVYYLSEALDDKARAVQMLENASIQYEDNVIFPNKNTRDPTVWDLVLTQNRRESAELAKIISKHVRTSRLTFSRGVKTARFHVLKWTDKPAILVETGFITNRKEARRLSNSRYQDRLATQITRGILDYKDLFERTNGFTR